MENFDQTPENPTEETAPAYNEKDNHNFAMFTHLAGLLAFIAIPFANIIGPLILWLIKKDELPLVDHAGKEAINFQISMTIYAFIAGLLCIILIGFIILPILAVVDVVMIVKAAIRASKGEEFTYPISIRFIK